MESENHKIIRNFLLPGEKEEIIDWVKSINFTQSINNHHIKEVRKNLNGNSYMFDISKTSETKKITEFQSSGNVINETPPQIIINLIDRISKEIKISKDNVFFQVIDMNSGGKVNPHYDATINGFINYKCNISVLSEIYEFYIDNDVMNINEGDLYCFEASLYKHWSNEFNFNRILLSFGFVLKYSELGRNEYDHRVRLSNRIEKYFQKNPSI
jgi:hypothetical protein